MKSSLLKAQVEEWIYRSLSDTAWLTINQNITARINRHVRCIANMERSTISPTELKNAIILPSDYLGIKSIRINDEVVGYTTFSMMYGSNPPEFRAYTTVGYELLLNFSIQSPAMLHLNYYKKAGLLDEEVDSKHTISDALPDVYLYLANAEAFNFSFDTPNADKFGKTAMDTINNVNDDHVVNLWSDPSPAIQAA